jgi:hypothetical protein
MNHGTGPGASGTPGSKRALRRMMIRGALRAAGSTTALVALYYVLPLDRMSSAVAVTTLIIGLVLLVTLISFHVRAIIESQYPNLRAVEALAVSLPFFLLLFASTYLALSSISDGNFSEPLTHTDAMYFAMTVFSTVGFGDITAKSETARLVVTGQMAADLIVLGLGAKVILGAVTRSRQQQPKGAGGAPSGS